MTKRPEITPADQGIITVTLDDARSLGLGDDDTVDLVQAALMSEGEFNECDAALFTYRAVHGWPNDA